MATNGIDFVIGGKDQAKPAMSAVEKSLERLEQKTGVLGVATAKLATITAGFASAVWLAEKASGYLVRGIESINAAYDAQAGPTSLVAQATMSADAAITSLMVSVGKLLAPIRVLVSAGIETLANSLSTILTPAVEYATEVLGNIGPLVDWVKEKVIQGVNLMVGAFTFFEVVLTNLDSVWEMAVSQSEIWMLQLVGVIEHALTVAIPAYATWFGENFVNLMRDGLNLSYTVTVNSIRKIVDAFAALWEYVASWGETDIMSQLGEIGGRSFLEGFESSLTELPDIAARTITDREKELTEKIGQVGANLGDEFSRKMKERMLGIGDGANSALSKDIDLKIKKTVDNATGAASGGKSGSQAGTLTASESRLLSRGQVDPMRDWMREAAINLAMILSGTNATAKATDELNKKTPQFAPEDEVKLVMVQ